MMHNCGLHNRKRDGSLVLSDFGAGCLLGFHVLNIIVKSEYLLYTKEL
jgi:hypothetical protein